MTTPAPICPHCQSDDLTPWHSDAVVLVVMVLCRDCGRTHDLHPVTLEGEQ